MCILRFVSKAHPKTLKVSLEESRLRMIRAACNRCRLFPEPTDSTISNIYIHGVVDYNGSPHKNKKAYDIDMVYSLGVQNYTSKLGINLFPLANVGKYTLIMEYYFSSDNTNIVIIAESTKTTLIKKYTTFDGPNYKKYLVQFDFPSKANPPHFLYFTISGTGTTSTNPEGYLVFYGVKGWDDAVPSEIYDHALETGMFEYDNGNMKMYHDIDMDNHRIRNIPPATNPTDLLMKQSLEIHQIYLYGMVINRHLTSEGIRLQLYNPYIKSISLFGGNKYKNMKDQLTIRALDILPLLTILLFIHQLMDMLI